MKKDILTENETSVKSAMRDNTQKTMYIIGDSHTWGQGSLGQTDMYDTAHAVYYGSRGYANRLKEDLYKAWGTVPVRFIPILEENNAFDLLNEETYTISLSLSAGKGSINYSYGLPKDENDRKWWASADKNADLYSYNSVIGFYDEHVMDCKFTPDKNVFAIGKRKFEIDSKFDDFIGECDLSGRYGITKPVLTFNNEFKTLFFVCARTVPDTFLNSIGKQLFVKFAAGRTIPVILHAVKPINSKEYAMCLSLMDGCCMEMSDLEAEFEEEYDIVKVYGSITSTIIIPIGKPQRLISFHLMKSKYHNCDVKVTMLSCRQDAVFDLLKRSSDNEINAVSYTDEKIIKTNDGTNTYFEISCSGDEHKENFYIITSDRPVSGILKIEAVNKFNDFSISQDSKMFSTRGVIIGNMNKIILAGMGAHSVGNWIGIGTDLCNHAGGVRNHIREYKQTELIHKKEKRLVIVQAPIVNEYIRQTDISTYKDNLSKLLTELDIYNENMLIFVATGQYMYDEVLLGTPEEGKISYSEYRQATKEWAMENKISFIDITREISELVHSGVPVTDFVMKNTDGTFDSNHPSHFSNMIWYETLRPHVIRKFA